MSRPLYFDTAEGPLFGVYHAPAPEHAGEGRSAVLFCGPWGWNESVSYHSRKLWAEALAGEGHPVLRFELPAVGDSSGRPDEADVVPRWIDSVGVAAERLAALAPGREVAVLGMELGGLLALAAAQAGAPIDALALWAAPRDGRGFLRLVKAFSRMQRWEGGPDGESPLPEGAIEAAGFVVSVETGEALRALKPTTAEPPAQVRRVLVLGRDESAPDAKLLAFLETGEAAVEGAPGPGWDDMVLHPSFTVPPPQTMATLATWLAAGAREGAGPTVDVPAGAALVEHEGRRERVIEDLPPQAFGILTEPADGAHGDETVVLLNSGAVRHIGTNRGWVDLARELAAHGVRSARLDLAGIGEADGPTARFAEVSEFYAADFGVQIGEVLDALERAGLGERFVVIGLCSGGYWSFRTALGDKRVSKAIMLNPGALRWRNSMVFENDGKGISMIAQPRLWRKLLRGEISPAKVGAFLDLAIRRLVKMVRHGFAGVRRQGEPPAGRIPGVEDDLDLLRDRGVGVVMAFSEDEVTHDKLVEAGIYDQLERWPNLRTVDLPGVDHALAPTSAQAAARRLILEELRVAVPSAAGTRSP
jgi:alpha-beta hydrolase superfamily lysophospholipase